MTAISDRLVVTHLGAILDAGVATGQGVIVSIEDYLAAPAGPMDYTDAATSLGRAVVASADHAITVNTGTAKGTAVISAFDTLNQTGIPFNDLDTVASTAILAAADVFGHTDAAVAGGRAILTSTDLYTTPAVFVDANTAHGVALVSSLDGQNGTEVGSDLFTRVVISDIGRATSGQLWQIDQGTNHLSDWNVNGSALTVRMSHDIDTPAASLQVDVAAAEVSFAYSWDTAPTGSIQRIGPAWWIVDGITHYRLEVTQTVGGNTNLLVEQHVTGATNIVPMDWGAGPVTTVKAIPSQVANVVYRAKVRVVPTPNFSTICVRVWQESLGEPSTWLGVGTDIAGAVATHGRAGFHGQILSSNTNFPTYTIDNFTVRDLALIS